MARRVCRVCARPALPSELSGWVDRLSITPFLNNARLANLLVFGYNGDFRKRPAIAQAEITVGRSDKADSRKQFIGGLGI